jgi:hypothetical protein
VIPKIKRGDLTEVGYSFRIANKTTDEAWNDARTERTLKAVNLARGSIALVGRGAAPATSGERKCAGRSTLEQRTETARRIGNRCGPLALRAAGASGGTRRASRSGRDQLDLAKAKRARLRRAESYVHGSHPTPKGRYDQDELDALGERGLALKLPSGKYAYGITGLADLMNSLAAYKSPNCNNYSGLVRSWIVERAIKLGLVERLPKGWAEPKYKPHPNEYGPTGSGGTALPGGLAARAPARGAGHPSNLAGFVHPPGGLERRASAVALAARPDGAQGRFSVSPWASATRRVWRNLNAPRNDRLGATFP